MIQISSIITIVGPTAVGKTEVAIELANIINGEIVSADSMALYKYMDIGTAKPSQSEQAKAIFHLIDYVDPKTNYNVGEFQKDAHNAINTIISKEKHAIIVGGSGLYVRAAIDGLEDEIPSQDLAIRKELENIAEFEGKEELHRLLSNIDPVSADRIHCNNVKRVIRAIEIYKITGITATEFYSAHKKKQIKFPNTLQFGLKMDRKKLYQRIEDRVDKMIDMGLVDEVKSILSSGVDTNTTAMQGLGYKEIVSYLNGHISLDEAVALLKKNTRHFSKRQFTWFNADKRVYWVDIGDMDAKKVSYIIKEIISNDKNSVEPAG